MAGHAEVPKQKAEDEETKPEIKRQDSAPERRALYAQKHDTFNDSKEPEV